MRRADPSVRPGALPWTALASVSVAGALLSLTASLLAAPRGLVLPEPLLSVLAASVVLLAAAQLAAWWMATALARVVPVPREPLLASLSASLLCAAAFAPLLDWWGAGGFRRGQTLLLGACLGLCVVSGAALAWRIARDAGPEAPARWLAGLLLRAGPWLGAVTCSYVWLQIHSIGSWLSTSSLLATFAWTAACCAVALVFRRPRPRWLLAAAVAGCVLAPGVVRVVSGVGPGRGAGPDAGCVVLLSIDTLRADALRAFDPQAPPHPHLDRLLDESLVFVDARSAGPWTKPAFASVLTGLSPWVHGANDAEARLPDEVRTLAEELRAAGWRTAAFGRNSFLTDTFHFDQGFDHYEFYPKGGLGASWGGQLLTALGAHPKSVDTEQLTDRAVDWVLREAQPPLFLWLHYFDPHLPYRPPTSFAPRDPAPTRIGESFSGLREVRSGALRPTAEERRRIRALYEAELRYVDANAGRFLGALEERGLYDACHVAFLSDHGEEFWEHGGYEHGHTLYDELLRVPLALKLAGSRRSGRIEAPVSTGSLFATLLDLAGVEVDPALPVAPPLTPLWEGAGHAEPRVVASTGMAYGEPMRSVVFGGLKYIEATDRSELYDLRADPEERRPLERRAAVRRARALLAEREREARRARAELGLSPGPVHALDPETRAELVALGYLE